MGAARHRKRERLALFVDRALETRNGVLRERTAHRYGDYAVAGEGVVAAMLERHRHRDGSYSQSGRIGLQRGLHRNGPGGWNSRR